MISAQKKFNQTLVCLKMTFGAFLILTGVDKFGNWITIWERYVSPFIKQALPIDLSTFLMGVGLLEIILGLLFFTKWVREAAYFASAWIVLCVINIISCGTYVDIALRDLVAASGAFALARLCEVKDQMKL